MWEIGFGPGVAIQKMCDSVTDRNKNAILSGKVKLISDYL